ncbi:MAG: D-Ala-D-Ala carboxypeptidase family metallohydrolase, partial [Acidobacteria bacterium]|nr:D-Ala-D-Ala carboxypeptidase family metallohydrolase [Acidobacteriota bacterium]
VINPRSSADLAVEAAPPAEGTESPLAETVSEAQPEVVGETVTDTTPVTSALVINEILYNSDAVADNVGEWLELFNPGASDYVEVMAVQPDGKIVVGGNFTTLGGGGRGTTTRNYIGRLNADGSLDAGFNPGADDQFNPLVVQRDGKILVGGAFKMLGGGGTGTTARNYIGRLNADGSLDTGFNPGANFFVLALAVQADGKILVGGEFSALGGGGTGTTARNGIGRLNADGSLDAGFNPGATDLVAALAVQPDGRILVVGEFTTLGGGGTGTTTRNRIGRLDVDSQGPGAPSGLTASASGTSVALAWSAPTTGGAPAAYTIEAGSGPGLTNLANFSTGNTATTFAASGVGSGTYYLRVRATNNAGTSGPSNEAIMVVGGGGCTVPPGAPGGFTLTQNSGGNVAFRWTAAAGGPTTYVLEAGSAPGLANLANVDLGGTGTTFATSGVGAGTYYVRVRARNACGLGAASNELVLLVSTACGDERDSIISEYRAYEVPWTPTCSDFATGGGTTNFSWTELNRLPGSGHPPWGIIRQVLWEGLENTRSQYNRGRVTITSGYRCPHGNADPSIRGATSSRHLYGDAADMKSMDHPWSYDEWDLLRGAAIRAGAWIEPYELSPSHVHADWWGGRTMPSTAFALADRTLGRVPADQEQIAGRLESDSHNERMAAIGSVLTIPLLERQLSLELALTRELARLREQNSLRRQARLAAESLAPPVDEGEYLFSLIEAVSQSANPDIIAALVPWLGTGNRAITAVAALGDRSVSEIATVAMDPTDEEASVALLVLKQMILDQVRYPLSAASRRMIVNSAERRLVGIQRVAVLQEAIELAVA